MRPDPLGDKRSAGRRLMHAAVAAIALTACASTAVRTVADYDRGSAPAEKSPRMPIRVPSRRRRIRRNTGWDPSIRRTAPATGCTIPACRPAVISARSPEVSPNTTSEGSYRKDFVRAEMR